MDEASGGFGIQMSAEDALAVWRESLEPSATVAFCNWIAGHGGNPPQLAYFTRITLVSIAREGVRRHPMRLGVLVAVGRMLLAAGELTLALDVLVRAAQLGAGEPLVFRLLGEVLFRRGDPARAHRMFERAVADGLTDPGTLEWLDRARVYAAPMSNPPSAPGSVPPASDVRTRSGVRLAAATHWSEPRKKIG